MPVRTDGDFTPTERRILKVLSDGEPHREADLLACIPDEMANRKNLQVHLTRLRGKLPPGHVILVQVVNRRTFRYRHVLRLPPPRRRT